MKAVLTWVLIFLTLFTNAQKNCTPNLDSVKMMLYTDYISLTDIIQTLNLTTQNKKRYIPKFIRRALGCWREGKFRIVNPGKYYNNTDAMLGNRPTRQLTYLGSNANFLIIAYNHGGFGFHEHILVFQYLNRIINKFWNIPGKANSKEEVIQRLKQMERNFRIKNFEF